MKIIIPLLFLLVSSGFAQDEYFGQNKVQYNKLDWYTIQTRNFDIYFYKGQDTIAVFATRVLEDAYKEVSSQLNHVLTARVPVIIYSSPNEFQQTNVIPDLLPEGVGGFTEIFKNRIVVPFNGSYEDFRHVLHHELTHAVVFNLLYENAISSLISRQALFSPPLWLSEGFAEYSSRRGWDYEADMYLRDAVINGYLPPLEQMQGFLNYKAGQAAVLYIVENYGAPTIPELFNKGKVTLSLNKAMRTVMGMDMKKLSDDWQKELRRVYWPEISERMTVDEIGKVLTDHRKDGSIYNQNPAWSPAGDRIAITTDRANPRDGYSDRFNEIYVISTIDGRVIDKIIKGERSGDLESLHSYFSRMSWSPKGDKLVFVSKSHGADALMFIDVDSKKIYKRFRPQLEVLRNPHWSPAGGKIIVTGVRAGYSDLYVLDIESGEFNRLTFDSYDDIDPKFSPDGHLVAFASDRPVESDSLGNHKPGIYNIFIYDLIENKIRPITHDTTKSVQPDFSPDGKLLAYSSFRNGIPNIYIYDFDKGKDFAVTDVLSGLFSPSWSPDGQKIAVSAFVHGGFDILVIKDIKPLTETGKLAPTKFARTGKLFTERKILADENGKDSLQTIPTKPDFSRYIFKAGEEKILGESSQTDTLQKEDQAKQKELAEFFQDTVKYQAPDGSFIKKKYSPKFGLDLAAGGFSYDTFYGLRGESYIAVSDVLGNHNIFIATDVFNSIDQSNIQVLYQYLAGRIDYAIGAFHFKNLYYDYYNQYYFTDRVVGLMGVSSYPFSKFNRIDVSLSQMTINRKHLDYFAPPDRTTNILLGGVSYVSDKVIWGIVGPVYGQRYKLSVEKSFKAVASGFSYTSAELDYRKYLHFGSDYSFALRFAGGFSEGKNARNFYLGGTSYWIDPGQKTEDIYDEKDIYVNKLVVPLRGYRYFEFKGRHYFVTNVELRYPFVDYLKMRVPFGLTLGYVRGSIFLDVGAAFDRPEDFKWFDDKRGFPKLATPKGGLGFSVQSNLGFLVLRFDTAWRTDLAGVYGKPRYYFSFGANY